MLQIQGNRKNLCAFSVIPKQQTEHFVAAPEILNGQEKVDDNHTRELRTAASEEHIVGKQKLVFWRELL